MNDTYRVGKAGGMAKIAMPIDTVGNEYVRSVWKDGTIVFRLVKEEPVQEDSE